MDLISRQAAIDAHCELCDMNDKCICIYCKDIERFMKLPTADLSEYCDKLWKTAYERGKEDAEPEIIRCKDCYHYPSEYSDCPMTGWFRCEDDYCSRAERRTDE